MIAWALLDPTGRVPVSLGRTASMPNGAVALPDGIDVETAAQMYVADARWSPRPLTSPPNVEQDAGQAVVSWSGLPTGSVVHVLDGQTGEELAVVPDVDSLVSITLVDPGLYLMDVIAPLPWIGWSGEVTL